MTRRESFLNSFCILLSLIGLGLCSYLGFSYLALMSGELVGGAVCGGESSRLFNCYAVSASPWGVFLGLPLAFWGAAGYLAVLMFFIIAWQFPNHKKQAWVSAVWLTGIFVLTDIVLFAIMWLRIHYFCPLCLLTYAVNAALLFTAKAQSKTPWREIIQEAGPSLAAIGIPKPNHAVSILFFAVVVTGAAGLLGIYEFSMHFIQGNLKKNVSQYVSQQKPVVVETVGSPTLGTADAKFHIVEFSDFLCPACQQASKYNTIMMAGNQDRFSLTFKNYPLDADCNASVQQTIHPGACQIAAAAACAAEQRKFWEFHDAVYRKAGPYKLADIPNDAARVGLDPNAFFNCVQSGRGSEAVKRDIEEAKRLGIKKTPTYILNGVTVESTLTPVVFKAFLDVLTTSQNVNKTSTETKKS